MVSMITARRPLDSSARVGCLVVVLAAAACAPSYDHYSLPERPTLLDCHLDPAGFCSCYPANFTASGLRCDSTFHGSAVCCAQTYYDLNTSTATWSCFCDSRSGAACGEHEQQVDACSGPLQTEEPQFCTPD